MIRPRIESRKVEELREFYESKNQVFKNDTHMLQHLIESFIDSNYLELLQKGELLDSTIREIIDSNVRIFSNSITGEILEPLKDLSVHSTMILKLLADEVCIGMTENEKAIRLAEVKKEALKSMAVDGGIQSLYSLVNNE